MKFIPLSPNLLDAPDLLPSGKYEFTIQHAEEKISSRGNPMLVITYEVRDDVNNAITIKDYLVDLPSAHFKLKQFCDALNIDYFDGQLDVNTLIKKRGSFVVVEETYEDKNNVTRKKNSVKEYISASSSQETDTLDFHDDTIPF